MINSKFYKINDFLYRGERPDEHILRNLISLGVKAVMSLESGLISKEPEYVKKERRLVEDLGIKFIHVPLHPIKCPSIVEIKRALSLIMQKENQPVFVHCERGNDRTGIIIAAYRIKMEGWDFENAFREMKSFGHRSKILFWWSSVLLSIKNHGRID